MDINPRKLGWTFEGGRIQASIPKHLVKNWREKIVQFNMYVMSNFIVVDKMEKVKTTTNRWTINFSNKTRVVPIVHPSYPLEAFCFQPISEFLAADKLDDSILIDVIGEVVGKEDLRKMITSKGKETKRLVVLIEDFENNSIGCVLFREIVDQILAHLEEEKVEPLIIIAQFFRSRKWNGKAKESEGYLPTLDGMMDRKLLFKVNVKAVNIKQYDQVYTVMKICDDEEIVETNHSKEMHNATSATITETGYSDSIDMSTVVVNRKNDTNSMTKQALPINLDNEDEMGFSTNKFTRKNRKRQKNQISETEN
ncbi:hypothetical protein AHAS_Ahas06G0020900 [Arachis hypogaea]